MFSKIKPYWAFSSNEIKSGFAYRGKFYFLMLGRIFSMFITYYLWVAIYSNDGNAVLGGFSKDEITLYVFMSYVVSGYALIGISQQIGSSVIDGSIAMNLIKPLNYRMSLIFKAFGSMIYNFVVPSLFIWIGIEIYRKFVLGLAITDISNIVLFLLSSFFSFLIYVLFDYIFGMLTFYTTYIFGLQIAKNAILGILTGQLIPLSFFPDLLQKIFKLFPFSYMTYYPVIIYMGKCSVMEICDILCRQIIWIIMLYIFGSIIWKKVTKKLVVLGG